MKSGKHSGQIYEGVWKPKKVSVWIWIFQIYTITRNYNFLVLRQIKQQQYKFSETAISGVDNADNLHLMTPPTDHNEGVRKNQKINGVDKQIVLQ